MEETKFEQLQLPFFAETQVSAIERYWELVPYDFSLVSADLSALCREYARRDNRRVRPEAYRKDTDFLT
jgi:hypothetical protein